MVGAKNGVADILKQPSPQLYQCETIDIDKLVPEGQLVREIYTATGLEFFRETIARFYCPDNDKSSSTRYTLLE